MSLIRTIMAFREIANCRALKLPGVFFPTRFFWVRGSGAAVQQTGSAAAADEGLQGSGCVLVGRYVISTLELLVAEDYMIVYLNGATPRRRMPGFSWLKRCYQMIDRR